MKYYYYDSTVVSLVWSTFFQLQSLKSLHRNKKNFIEIDVKMEIELLIIQFLDLLVCTVFILFI